MRQLLIPFLGLTLVLAGCGGGSSTAPTAPSAPQEAVARVGDITVRASALPTLTLSPQIAQQYGIDRDARTVMLLVGLRRGADGQEVAVPARIRATATTLGGQRQELSLRELRSGEWIDYIGTVQTTPPETLRFDVEATAEGGGQVTMQFSREIYPQ